MSDCLGLRGVDGLLPAETWLRYPSPSEAVLEDTHQIIFDPEEIILTECGGDITLLKK